MSKIANPHDRYFKASMSDLRVAKSFLHAHLPDKILKRIDLSSLKLAPSHHVDPRLSETMTDMLYRVSFEEGEEGYIALLVEHQSTAERLMPFRVLSYIINIMRDHLKEHPKADLPLVVPLVFYSGKAAYPYTQDIFELFGALEPLARDIFLKPFQLIDLCRIPDAELRKHTWASVMELVEKHIWAKNLLPFLKVLTPFLRKLEKEGGDDYLYATLHYICHAGEMDNSEEFVKIINNEVSPTLGDKMMSLAKQWHDNGRADGRAAGRMEGRMEGRVEGRVEGETIGLQKGEKAEKQAIAQRMLKEGVDLKFIVKITGLTIEEIDSLR